MYPIVVLLDIDGTIIGDITTQVLEWEITSELNPGKLKQLKIKIKEHLQGGLVRPHFADFITSIKARHDNVEFFVYTASDDKWANFLIPCIEQALSISISRPIFSRKHCIMNSGTLYKSFSKVAPLIHTKLKKKYGNLQVKHILKNMMIIDNNNVLIDNRKFCIHCSTYEWLDVYDVCRLLEIKQNNFELLGRALKRYSYIDSVPHKLELLYSLYYTSLGKQFKTYSTLKHELQEQRDKDTFWLQISTYMLNALRKNYDRDSIVKYIVQKISHDEK